MEAADGTTLTRKAEIRARWAGLFELHRVDPPHPPPDREFPLDVDAVRDADHMSAVIHPP